MAPKQKTTEMYRDIPVYQIDRMSHLAGVKHRLDSQYGPGAWGRDEVVDYMNGQKAAAAEEAGNGQKEDPAVHARSIALGKKRAAYMKSLTDVTPADQVMIEQMCEIEQQLDELSTPSSAKDETGASLKARSDVRIKLIGELRRIQNDMGIGRSTRIDQVDQAQVTRSYVEGANKLVAERGVRIECPHCKGATKINQGIIIFNFSKHVPWKWTSTCPNPKCGLEFTLEGGPIAQSNQ